jgi:hypothetical protein
MRFDPIAKRLILGLTALVICDVAKESHAAVITVPNVADGTQYRLIFVTSGARDARSSNIADYNSFVQAEANLSPELVALNTTWTAIGSTLTVDARDNTATNPNTAVGVAFYNLHGLKIANNNADLWDGLLLTSITWDQFDVFHDTASPVWTGTHHTGIASANPLGGSVQFPFAQFGLPSFVGAGWVNGGSSHINDGVSDLASMYAVSGVLTAGASTAAVPEPGACLMYGLGAFVLLLSRRVRNTRS